MKEKKERDDHAKIAREHPIVEEKEKMEKEEQKESMKKAEAGVVNYTPEYG